VRSLAAGLLVWLAGAASSGGTLDEAHIQIAVRGDTASVIAWYRFAGTGGSLRLGATRPAGQTLIFQGVDDAIDFRLDTLPARFELVSHQADPAPALDVRYHVIGALDSIPLFVPKPPTAPGRSEVLIRVFGSATPARHAVPSFRREPGDGWLAHPDRVPACVTLTTGR
jgi:hypothetical protein